MSVTHVQVLGLYRRLLRQGKLFKSFNYREYALRRVRDYFKDSKCLKDQKAIEREYQYGLESLEMLQRQTVLNALYSGPALVVEHLPQ
ncbi:hypothetical protein EMCRGX_G030840 [Ephydatia muelleri]